MQRAIAALACTVALTGCDGSSKHSRTTSQSDAQARDTAVAAFRVAEARNVGFAGRRSAPPPVDYQIDGLLIPVSQQPKANGCWAASSTMMLGWRRSAPNLRMSDVANELGQPFSGIFTNDEGLSPNLKPELLRRTGMRAEPPQNYSAQGWESLMRRHGPLWVTTWEGATCNRPFVHARIMTAIRGDGTPDRTRVTLADPANGQEVTETLSEFSTKFEREAKAIRARECPNIPADFRIQVVHW